MPNRITLYVDGGCTGNSQRDITKRAMVSVVTRKDGQVVAEVKNQGGSNNIAELIAVKEALKYCVAHGKDEAKVITDSKNNLAWVYGSKVGKKINDRQRVLDIKREIDELKKDVVLKLFWHPRSENKAGHYIENVYNL